MLSRKTSAAAHSSPQHARARASAHEHHVSAPVTPWTTRVALAVDIVHAAAVSTTTLPPVFVITASYAPPPITIRTALPPPTTATTAAPPPPPPPPPPANSETGKASWYQAPAGTCANLSLAFGTVVRVTNLSNNLTTTCRVEDRGPSVAGRIVDLSEQTFSQIADPSTGVIEVRITW